MPRSSIRSACSGSAGAGKHPARGAAGERRPRAPPASSPARRRSASSASGTATWAAATSAASPIASARSSTKARSCAARERDRAGRRPHAAAGAEQRDVALVRRPVARGAAQSKQPAAASACRSAGASIGRSTTPTAPQSSACALRGLRTGRRDQEDSRVGAARALAAHEVARGRERGVGREEDVGIGGSEQAPAARSRARSASAARSSLVEHRVASEQREADDHGALAAQQQPQVATARARAQAPARPPTGARTRDRDAPERSTRGREQLETARGDARPPGSTITTSTRRPGRSRRMSGADAGASSSATARSPRRSSDGRVPPGAGHRARGSRRRRGRSACAGRPAHRARRSSRACDRTRRSAQRRHRLADDPARGDRVPQREHRRLAARRRPAPGPSASADQREREAGSGEPVLAQPVEHPEGGSRSDRLGRQPAAGAA